MMKTRSLQLFFFDAPTAQSLIAGVEAFKKYEFDSAALKTHAKLFSIPIFREKLRNIVTSVIEDN